MRTMVESLKRLYGRQFITIVYLQSILEQNKITAEEYTYITGEEAPVAEEVTPE